MQLNELKPKNRLKKIKRVGRGGKRGTYSGRGQKGQNARSKNKHEPIIRGILKRYPKLRGYKNRVKKENIALLDLKYLDKRFKSNEKITPEALIEKSMVKKMKGKIPVIKILTGDYKLSKKLKIENCLFSKKVKETVEKAGGSIN